MLILPGELLSTILASCEAAYPEEACGVLLGRVDGDDRVVTRTEAAGNESGGDKRRRFEIAPTTLMRLMREERAGGPAIIGFYHSHPDHPPVPSPTDKAASWPTYSYPIFSVVAGRASSWASWRLDESGDDYVGEVVKVG